MNQPSGSNTPRPGFDAQGLPQGYNFRTDWEVTPRQVKSMLDAKQSFVLIDCRTPMEHDLVNLPAAQLLPLQELGARLDELEEHKNEKMVVFCHHGGRSLQMASILRQRGFKDVKSMAGGIELWAMDVEPGMKRY